MRWWKHWGAGVYVGALGSRATTRNARGCSNSMCRPEIARLRPDRPSAATPPQIAVSILAEITAVKNGVALPTAATAVAKERIAPSDACPSRQPHGRGVPRRWRRTPGGGLATSTVHGNVSQKSA
jgi:hypothetical protein